MNRKLELRFAAGFTGLLLLLSVIVWFAFPDRSLEILWRLGAHDWAVSSAQRRLLKHDSTTARLIIARGHWAQNRPDLAIRMLGHRFPDDVPLADCLRHGNVLLQMGAAEQSFQLTNQLLGLYPDDASLLKLRSLAAALTGRLSDAEQAVGKLREINESTVSHATFALIAEQREDNQQAIEHWEQFLKGGDLAKYAWLEARRRQTVLSLTLDRHEQAVAFARSYHRHSPEKIEAHLLLARALRVDGRADEGHAMLKKALQRFPDSWEIRAELVELTLATSDHSELNALLRDARQQTKNDQWPAVVNQARLWTQRFPDNDTLLGHYALSCFVSGRDEEALTAAKDLQNRKSAEAPIGHAITASIWHDRGDHERALPYWRSAIREAQTIRKRHPELDLTFLRISYANSALSVGYLNEVIEQTDLVIADRPQTIAAYRLKSAVLEMKGETEPAISVLKASAEHQPLTPEIEHRLASMMMGIGKSESAVRMLQPRLDEDKDSVPLRQLLARAILRTPDRAEEFGSAGQSQW